jgi:hypothetical protein
MVPGFSMIGPSSVLSPDTLIEMRAEEARLRPILREGANDSVGLDSDFTISLNIVERSLLGPDVCKRYQKTTA